MTALSRMFEKYAIKTKKWIKENPVKEAEKPKINNDRVRFLDDDERAKLLTACKESTSNCLYLCVVLAISTGMRQGELMGLQWQDVNIKGGFLILNETKNGERRRVHLSGLGLELLRNHAKVRRLDTPLLFPSLSNPQQPIGLKRAWETALKRAEITNFHWHDLRHCTASYLAMNGASLVEIAEVLGHKTLAVTQRYAHLSDGHVSNVVASMNAKIFGGV
jgi:integrase